MAKRFDSYLSRLESKLQRSLPKAVAEEYVLEIADHLEECVAEQIQGGASEQAATIAALRHVGSDGAVADGFIRAYTGIDRKSVWRLAWFPTVLVACYCLVGTIESGQKHSSDTISLWFAGLSLSCLLTFVYACWHSRRFLVKPIAVALLFGFLLSVGQMALSPSGDVSRTLELRRNTIAQNRNQIAELDAKIAQATSIETTLHSAKGSASLGVLLAPKQVPEHAESRVSDGAPSISRIELVQVQSVDVARQLWKQNGTRYLRILDMVLASARRNLNRWQSGLLLVPGIAGVTLSVAVMFVEFWLGIAALNLIILGLGRLHRAALGRLWRPV